MRELFEKVLRGPHTHLEEETASFRIERDARTLRLLFEKSNGSTDWRNNLRFLAVPCKPYKDMDATWFAHRGFLRVWRAIEPHTAEHIQDPTIRRIEIAGYSHGAAVALLCFEYCKYHRPDIPVTGIGFGAPRVFWGPLPRALKDRVADFCVVRNGNDLVTHLPPLLFGYRQAGRLAKIGTAEGFVRDHYPDSYLYALSAFDDK